MLRASVRCLLLLGLIDHALAALSIGGVQKVIQMLTDISDKAKKEKADEEVAFAKFRTWCSQETAGLQGDVAQNGRDVELLTASVAKLRSDAKTLGDAVAALNTEVTRLKADEQAQRDQRAKDYADFQAREQDFAESVDAVGRAIRVLEQKSQDVPGAKAALLQMTDEGRLPARAQSVVAAFLGLLREGSADEDPDFSSYSAPVADAYEFQSGGIINVLKRLQDEFRGKLAATQKEEMNSKHAYDMIMQDLGDSIKGAEKQASEKTSAKFGKEEKAALDQKQLSSTLNVKAENERTLADLQAECSQKALSFQEKQRLRAEEVEALAKAREILASPEVLGSAQKHLTLAQARGAAVLLQLGRRAAAGSPSLKGRVRDFLAEEGRRLRSRRLELLAAHVGEDVFGKVKGLISQLLTKLYNEADEDAKHEGFCDAELGKSQLTRARLTESIDALTAAIDGGKGTILRLSDSTANLVQEVLQLQQAVASATDLRAEEKAKNAETVRDAEAAAAAVVKATAVLRDFYSKALTATGLLQVAAEPARQWGVKATIRMGSPEWQALANPSFDASKLDTGHKEGMQTFGATYQGAQDEINNGVLALMEVIQSDFATLKADTLAAEVASQRAFEEFTKESKKSLAVKQQSIEMNNRDKAAAESRVQEDTKDLKGTEDELLAAERYHEQLVPQCIDQGVSFEKRTKDREGEIASLKQALSILGSSDIA